MIRLLMSLIGQRRADFWLSSRPPTKDGESFEMSASRLKRASLRVVMHRAADAENTLDVPPVSMKSAALRSIIHNGYGGENTLSAESFSITSARLTTVVYSTADRENVFDVPPVSLAAATLHKRGFSVASSSDDLIQTDPIELKSARLYTE